jgi:hypothetical protein
MRQLTFILAALTVAAVQVHAGILDWLRGSPAKDSSADATASFQRGVARLQEHRDRIFFNTSGTIDITYDVKKTDSLIEPVVGILKIVEKRGDVSAISDLRLVFRDGSWVISSYTFTLAPTHFSTLVKPDSRAWKAIQACFVSDEAATAAVEATPTETPSPVP